METRSSEPPRGSSSVGGSRAGGQSGHDGQLEYDGHALRDQWGFGPSKSEAKLISCLLVSPRGSSSSVRSSFLSYASSDPQAKTINEASVASSINAETEKRLPPPVPLPVDTHSDVNYDVAMDPRSLQSLAKIEQGALWVKGHPNTNTHDGVAEALVCHLQAAGRRPVAAALVRTGQRPLYDGSSVTLDAAEVRVGG